MLGRFVPIATKENKSISRKASNFSIASKTTTKQRRNIIIKCDLSDFEIGRPNVLRISFVQVEHWHSVDARFNTIDSIWSRRIKPEKLKLSGARVVIDSQLTLNSKSGEKSDEEWNGKWSWLGWAKMDKKAILNDFLYLSVEDFFFSFSRGHIDQ